MEGLTRKQFLAASGVAAGALRAGNALGVGDLAAPAPAEAAAMQAALASGNNDQLEKARAKIQSTWYLPVEDLDPAIDGTVLNLMPGQDIKQRQALTSDFAWDLTTRSYVGVAAPRYDGPYAQFSHFTMDHILPAYKR
jgi:hypothetical protein